jgi:hyaluronoglucosaminidase
MRRVRPAGSFVVGAVLFAAGLVAVSPAGAGAAQAQDTAPPAVVPPPQQEQPRAGSIQVPATVGEVVGHGTDAPARSALDALLRADGVSRIVVRYDDQPAPDTAVTFVVGTPQVNSAVAPALAALDAAGPSGLPAGGYVLAAGSAAGHPSVVLAGVDGAGTFYAVQTLRQLLVAQGGGARLGDVVVRDWPSMPIRGVIEGFYGPPWSTADRISSFVFDGQSKMNTYVYSPKDDPYLRARWREPYPSDQLAVIKNLIQSAAANHVTFTYALSPGLSICFRLRPTWTR